MKKTEELKFECKDSKAKCDWCDASSEDIWACVIHKNGEGGQCHLHICGDCNDEHFKLTKRAEKKHAWGEL